MSQSSPESIIPRALAHLKRLEGEARAATPGPLKIHKRCEGLKGLEWAFITGSLDPHWPIAELEHSRPIADAESFVSAVNSSPGHLEAMRRLVEKKCPWCDGARQMQKARATSAWTTALEWHPCTACAYDMETLRLWVEAMDKVGGA